VRLPLHRQWIMIFEKALTVLYDLGNDYYQLITVPPIEEIYIPIKKYNDIQCPKCKSNNLKPLNNQAPMGWINCNHWYETWQCKNCKAKTKSNLPTHTNPYRGVKI